MTAKEKELLVKLIADGKNTYKNLHTVLPNLSSTTLKSIALNLPGNLNSPLIKLTKSLSYSETLNYHFKDTDTFELTEHGKDLLYQLQKEQKSEYREKAILLLTVISVIISIIALFKP